MHWKTLMAAGAATFALSTVAAGSALAGQESANPPAGSLAAATSVEPATTETEARARVEAAGYSDVRNIRGDANGWTATAARNGKSVTVKVDATGKVSHTAPMK